MWRIYSVVITLVLTLSGCLSVDLGSRELADRTLTRTYTVSPQSQVRVAIDGGSVMTTTGEPGTVRVELTERVPAGSDAEMAAVLEKYEVSLQQDGDVVAVIAKRRRTSDLERTRNRVRFSARLVVPADVAMELRTGGGTISSEGSRTAALSASTGGGSIDVDGGTGKLALDTGGGSITVDRVMSSLQAQTGGGSVTVHHIGRDAANVDVKTGGGSIRLAVDPAASLSVNAATGGGRVRVEGLPWDGETEKRSSRAVGAINGGVGKLRARSGGGNVTIDAVDPLVTDAVK